MNKLFPVLTGKSRLPQLVLLMMPTPRAWCHKPSTHPAWVGSKLLCSGDAPLGLCYLEIATSFPIMQALNPTLGSTFEALRYLPSSTRL